jgi:DDE superfamily endonuclease
MGRTHAWTLKGHVRVDPRPMNWGNNLTMIGAVRCDQWLTMSTMFKSANKDRFVTWVRRRLLPKLGSGDVLILDNAPAHKDPRLVPLLRSHGVALRYLPPYLFTRLQPH